MAAVNKSVSLCVYRGECMLLSFLVNLGFYLSIMAANGSLTDKLMLKQAWIAGERNTNYPSMQEYYSSVGEVIHRLY
jgi:hypothetical protein